MKKRTSQPKKNGPRPGDMTGFVEELERMRAKYVAAGGKLLTRRELDREIAERRGLR